MIACSGVASGPIAARPPPSPQPVFARAKSLFGQRQQHEAPVQQRRERRRDRPQRRKRIERRPRLRRVVQLQQRQRLLQPPDARDIRVGGRRDLEQQVERLPCALLLQQVGGEVQPRAEIVGIARDQRPKQLFAALRFRRKCA